LSAVTSTGIFYSDLFLDHETGHGHPENSRRLLAIRERLQKGGIWEPLLREVEVVAGESVLRMNHSKAHIERVRAACKNAPSSLDADTPVSRESFAAAGLAAGAGIQAVDAVLAGDLQNAFCAVRPPGHHAEKERAMGFCLFNNIALAAHHLCAQHQLERILIIDWDVHHGNGTQNAFYDDSRVFCLSLHQWPLFPGSGTPEETGRGPGVGFNRNLTFAPSTAADVYLQAFSENVADVFQRYAPEFVLISAGFDAHRDDPLAALLLTEKDFAEMTRQVLDLAEKYASGRVVSFLEGGYNLEALAESVFAHVSVLKGH